MGGLKGAGEGKSGSELVRIQQAIARGEAREVTDADIEAELARTQAIWKAGGCGTCGCSRGETCDACPDCQPDEEKRLDAAEREPDSPSPPNLEAVMGSMPCVIAALVTLYARDRGISEHAAVVELVRVGLTHTILATTPESEKPGEGKSISPKPQQPACSECGRALPRRKLSWGSAGCRVCGRKRRGS